VPGVVHAVLVVSTISKGRIRQMTTSAAERGPGVLAVLTHLNAPRLPEDEKGNDPNRASARKLQLLQNDQVLYSNQPIGVVVADTLERAQYAASRIEVKYQTEDHNVVIERGLDRAYTPKKAGGGGDPSESSRGNPSLTETGGDRRVHNLYVTPVETHNPIELHSTIAFWEGNKLTVFDATQGVFGDRKRLASVLAIRPDDVHVVSLFLGGGFGSKGPTWSHVALAAVAAKRVNKPVKLSLSREQMFGPVGFRPETRQTVQLASESNGRLVALRHDTVTQTSSFDEYVEAASLPARMLYSCPNAGTSHKLVRVDTGTPSFMRAPGESPGTYALEAAMDELAYETQVDPVQLRLLNYAERDEEKNQPWSSKSLRECYAQGADRFGWSRRKPEPRSMRDGNRLVGLGMATAVYPTRRSEASARATLRPDGSVLVEAGTQDLGTGTYTIMTQVAADSLGVSPRQVIFRLGDTIFPETPVSGGSQTAASTGSAVSGAGAALREKLIQMAISDPASPLSGASTQDVVIEEGWLKLKSDSSRKESLARLATRGGTPIQAQAESKPGAEKERYSMYAFGAQFAEVHVDADLGQARVVRMVGAFAAGQILNAKTARSQLLGGMIWGIGMALLEDTMFDVKRGRIVNANLAEYHVPVNLDAPRIEVITIPEVDRQVNPIGAKGIGEIGITGAAAAIVNAIYHATGKRVRELPVTPDKLL